MVENSNEEDIKMLEKLDYLLDDVYSTGLVEDEERNKYQYAIEHILSDYKRVLKENEELKQEKINNYRMIALAQNEALGYMQGYEDGKKLKTSAIASIVENQQYYIIKKQMEKYEEHIAKLQKENEEFKRLHIQDNKHLDFIMQHSIPIQKVKDKIEELYKQDRNWSEEMSEPDSNFKNIDRNLKRIKNQIDVLLELLEGRE